VHVYTCVRVYVYAGCAAAPVKFRPRQLRQAAANRQLQLQTAGKLQLGRATTLAR